MRPLLERDVLQAWDSGESLHPIDRALTLLAAACPERTWDELAALSIGRRDALLLRLWQLMFGPRMAAFAKCPQCGEHLEFNVDTADLLGDIPGESHEQEVLLTTDGFHVRGRLPNSRDLASIADCDDETVACELLMRCCVVHARKDEEDVAFEALPENVIAALEARLEECDPLSRVLLGFHCPNCDHRCNMLLDVVSFLWAEISDRAKRLLHEVHVLASAYGWSEEDILALSAKRRQLYIDMVMQ